MTETPPTPRTSPEGYDPYNLATQPEGWRLKSQDRETVEIAVERTAHDAIHEVLKEIYKNFSPTDCADIILSTFKQVVEDPSVRDDILEWVKHIQSEEEK